LAPFGAATESKEIHGIYETALGGKATRMVFKKSFDALPRRPGSWRSKKRKGVLELRRCLRWTGIAEGKGGSAVSNAMRRKKCKGADSPSGGRGNPSRLEKRPSGTALLKRRANRGVRAVARCG